MNFAWFDSPLQHVLQGIQCEMSNRPGDNDMGPIRDAREVGCHALLSGYAWSLQHKARVHASSVSRDDGPFVCMGCNMDVIHRRPYHMRRHFAHHARVSPLDTSRESRLHHRCKTEIFHALRDAYPRGNWICDTRRVRRRTKNETINRQPDIGGRIGRQPLVIEVQRSTLGIRQLLARTADYTSMGIAILWIVPLTEDLGTDLFRPRLIERYLHSLYYGRVYYWLPGMGANVLPIHFSPAVRAVPYRTNEGGSWEDAGFINKPYKLIRRPKPYGSTMPIGHRFSPHTRPPFLPWGETQPLPPARLWRDTLWPWWDKCERSKLLSAYPDVEGSEGDDFDDQFADD